MYEYQSLELKNFHGGITDNYIDCQAHQYEKADNFLVSVNRELYTRPGSVIYDSVTYQLPSGSQRVNAIIDHFNSLLFLSSKQLYYINSGAWVNTGIEANHAHVVAVRDDAGDLVASLHLGRDFLGAPP